MEGQNIMYGGVDDLKQIRGMLEAMSDVKKQLDTLGAEKNSIEKNIEASEKQLRNNIENTVKKRREQVVVTFDKELANAQDKMRNARNEKNREKTKKVNKRIEDETANLVLENKNIAEEKKTYFKQKDIANFWDNALTYILYFPKSVKEIAFFILIFAVCLIGLPLLVVSLMDAHIVVEILVFILIDALWIVVYMAGYEIMRMRNKEAFLEMRKKRREIEKNNREIRKIRNRILRDKDESRYDLEKFDENINDIETAINDIVARKNAALGDFERVTKAEIADEITNKDKDKLEQLKKDLNYKTSKIKELEEKQKDMSLNLTTSYASYIGTENLNVRKIDAMIGAIESGQAKNISEAIAVVNQTK